MVDCNIGSDNGVAALCWSRMLRGTQVIVGHIGSEIGAEASPSILQRSLSILEHTDLATRESKVANGLIW